MNQQAVETAVPNTQLQEHFALAQTRKCLGWLICIEGSMLGDSFTLYNKTNHIGRAAHMDVALFREATVSRENHALIQYGIDSATYQLTASQDSDSPVLVNDKPITGTIYLHSYDRLQLGDCQLLFVALCGEQFCW